jgi:hypothetical protein
MGKLKVSIIFTILLSCLFFTSCTYRPEYPAEWAELILPQDERCLDISGAYVNSGESVDRQKSTYLSALFDFEEDPLTVRRVQIAKLENDNLEISAWSDGKLVSKKVYSKGDEQYSCSSKGIGIPIGKEEKPAGVPGERIILYLAKSADGSLVIERKSSATGYSSSYIPVIAIRFEWYRFKKIEIHATASNFAE